MKSRRWKEICSKAAAGDAVALSLLLEILQLKDQDVFAHFYQSYFPLVVSACLKYFDNKDDADETAQEVFIYVYSNGREVCNPRTFNSWLMKIVHRYCLKKTKEQMRFENCFTKSSQSASRNLIDQSQEEYFEHKELDELLCSLVKGLPFSQRKVLRLYYLENLSPTEIAQIINHKPSAVRKSLFDARCALRKELRKQGYYFSLKERDG